MEKIEFKNLPDRTTPLNAQNLNQMQENIDSSKANVQNVGELDFNSLENFGSGFFVISGTGNTPGGNAWYHVIQQYNGQKWIAQTARILWTNAVYTRIKSDGVWGKWFCTTEVYSTDEKLIGYWGNSPLYRRCLNGGYVSTLNLENNISIKKVEGLVITTTGYAFPINTYWGLSQSIGCIIQPDRHSLLLDHNESITPSTYELVIEYTKTTD